MLYVTDRQSGCGGLTAMLMVAAGAADPGVAGSARSLTRLGVRSLWCSARRLALTPAESASEFQ